MCGIVGYVGKREALPLLVQGLRRLEYRGYDSAGVTVVRGTDLWTARAVGRVDGVAQKVCDGPSSQVGIAHTRWATHGGVTEANAHPHRDASDRIAVVHNGIIENSGTLKRWLEGQGVAFQSETDTEVLPHLIRRYYDGDPVQAVTDALLQVQGTYGVAVTFADHPDLIIVARHGSPLVLGLSDHGNLVASDQQAILEHTRQVIHLEDREMAILRADGVETRRIDGTQIEKRVELIDQDWGVAEKSGHDHFMLKEIFEQPESIQRALGGRLDLNDGNAVLGGLGLGPRDLALIDRVHTVGCGTSHHSGMIGCLAVEHLARVPARAEIASEFRYRSPLIHRDALFFAISQSGETADTLGALEEIQLKGGQCMGLVNVVGSSIARMCGRGVYVHSGPEIAVASTKAFTSQVASLQVFSLMLGRTRDLSRSEGVIAAQGLAEVPDLLSRWLERVPAGLEGAVDAIVGSRYTQFLGRGFSYPVALEGALKLKELAYIPCEGYPAGEMKHGPIAMIEPGTPVVVIAPVGPQRERVISNIKEVQARGATLIVVHSEGDSELAHLADHSIAVPLTAEWISPLLTVVPLQLLAYRVACELGRDIDKPRNLAKSVTVE